jgi:pyrimidine operon attenuation protein/uracil phosphoribosyltransferase
MTLPDPIDLISSMAEQLSRHLSQKGINEPCIVGIRTGGIWIAQALIDTLKSSWLLGTLDVSFYRDDFTQNGLNPQVQPSALPFEVEGKHLVLVDDVLMTGRTIRAALNELFDYGRPASVTLVCLLDLEARELPIRPDIVGQTLFLEHDERIKLIGPAPLAFERKTLSSAS